MDKMPRAAKSKQTATTVAQLAEIADRDIRIGGDRDELKDSTVAIYVRQIMRIWRAAHSEHQWSPDEYLANIRHPQLQDNDAFEKEYKTKASPIIDTVLATYKSLESQVMTLNALAKMTKGRYQAAFQYYIAVRKVISQRNKRDKLDNSLTDKELKRYLSYEQLMAVPGKIKTAIVKRYGKLFLDNADLMQMTKKARLDYLRVVFDFMTIWLNINYPLRLVWPTVALSRSESPNWLEGSQLHLTDFKNVRLMGPQTIDLSADAVDLIRAFVEFLTRGLGETPKFILHRIWRGKALPYGLDHSGFSATISRLMDRYGGKAMNMNMIRHVVESHLIQSPGYARLTNKQKDALHAKLLHSFYAANVSYNKIGQLSSQPEASPEPEPEPDFGFDPDVPDELEERPMTQRAKRKGRVFRGEFKPDGSKHGFEIEIHSTE